MGKAELEILVATFGEAGLKRLASMIAPSAEGVEYVVSCQCPGHDSLPVPPELGRPDVKVIFSPTKGVAINRNNALRHASAPLCLLSDDDIAFTPGAFRSIISAFRSNPSVDIITFKFTGPDGKTTKPYPSSPSPLRPMPKGYYVSAVEVAFRREHVLSTGIDFNENFGVGLESFGSGEEELWIFDLLEAGLKGLLIPEHIAFHHHMQPTGVRLIATDPVLRSQGALLRRFHPLTSLPRLLLKARRVGKASGRSTLSSLRPLLYGWWQATLHPGRLFNRRKDTQRKPSPS
ncbi:MAG: glycosyltransferase [Muribaculaceae bacterium]|nr:glycosyltransferase [Muribaculaceae bacterium]MDE6423334.1 glycosyltransferase [Muribaculaceae bacterium]